MSKVFEDGVEELPINPIGYSGVKVTIIPYTFGNPVIKETVNLEPEIEESVSISETVEVTVT